MNPVSRPGASIGRFQLFSLAFGAILGAGWIVAVGSWIRTGGPVGTVCALIAGAAALSLIAACYAELAKLYPVTGGEVVYAERLFSREIAFYTGWFLFIVYVAVCAFSAISVGWIIETLLPRGQGQALYSVLGESIHMLGLAAGLLVVGLVWTINHLGVRAAMRFQDVLTVSMLASFVAFLFSALSVGRTGNLAPWLVGTHLSEHWTGALQVFATSPFWFSGFAVVSQAVGEEKDNGKRASLTPVFLAAIGLACAFYCAVVIAAAAALPRSQLLSLDLPAAGAFAAAFRSDWAAKLVLGIGLLGLLIALNAIFFAAARVLFAMARDDLLPRRLGFSSDIARSPTAACALVGLLSLLGTLLGRGAIGPLVDATAILLSAIYLMVCIATVRARRRIGRRDAWLPASAIFVTVLLMAVALVTPFQESAAGIPTEFKLIGASAVLGLVFHLWHRRAAFRAPP